MFEFNYITVKAINEFACLEDLAFALQAEVIDFNLLKVNSTLVDRSQFSYVLPIYSYELVELSVFAPKSKLIDCISTSDEDFLFLLAEENLWGSPRVIEPILSMTDEEFQQILPTIWDELL